MTSPPIVLASQSPRRAQLLSMLGLAFDVAPADIDESYFPGEVPSEHALRLAVTKAALIASRRGDALVVGSDTVVVLDGEVLGKPQNEEEALSMLMRLQGREHRVETGVAVIAPGERSGSDHGGLLVRLAAAATAPDPGVLGLLWQRNAEESAAGLRGAVEGVRVRFRPFDERTAREYVATGEPMDKAGAYGIQGYGATLVERIDGDYFAVMGLPVARMVQLLRELGYRYDFRGLEPLEGP